MLSRSQRLRRERDIKRLYRTGRRAGSGAVGIIVAPSRLPLSRFAYIVSKKNVRRAVDRNRVKRWLVEGTRSLGALGQGGHDALIIYRGGRTAPTFRQLTVDLEAALERAGLLTRTVH